MSTTTNRATGHAAPDRVDQLRVLHRVLLRSQVNRGRLAALAALAGIGVLVGLAIGVGDEVDEFAAGLNLASGYGLALLAPVVTLVFASAVLGDLVEDTTLVYLWLRPVPRLLIVVAAVTATLTAALPMVVLPLVAGTALSGGGGDLVAAAAASSTLAVVTYATVFCGLGLRARRALIWGLLYVAIWEGFVANAAGGAAKVAIRAYTRSLLTHWAGGDASEAEVAVWAAITFPLLFAMAAIAYTTRRLRRMDIP